MGMTLDECGRERVFLVRGCWDEPSHEWEEGRPIGEEGRRAKERIGIHIHSLAVTL